MSRCTCKTQKGVQCKKTALAGTKTCQLHKKCKSRVSSKAAKAPKKVAKKVAKRVSKRSSPLWIKSKAWESPNPTWLEMDKQIDVKPLSPQNADPWWLR